MDVDKILAAAVSFSNFFTIRLICGFLAVLIVFPVFGMEFDSASTYLSNLPLLDAALESYTNTITALGIDDVAIYLIFFVFITLLHLNYVFSLSIGKVIPPSFNFQSLENLEFLIWTDVSRLISERGGDEEARKTLTKKLAGAVDGIGNETSNLYSKSLSQSVEFYRLTKFFFFALIIITFFTYAFPSNPLLKGRAVPVLFLAFIGTLILGLRYYLISRNAHTQVVSNIRRRVEHVLRGEADEVFAQKMDGAIASYYARFSAKIDWNLPGVGSARVLVEPLLEKRKLKNNRNVREEQEK